MELKEDPLVEILLGLIIYIRTLMRRIINLDYITKRCN